MKNSFKPPIFVLALSTASAVVGMTLVAPAITSIKNEFNVSSDYVQLVLTFYLIFISLGQIFFGTLSDKFGRKPIILLGSLLYMSGGLLAIFSQSLNLLLFYRILQAFGAAACMSIARVIVNDSFEKSEAASKLSIITAVMVIFPILALILGGGITEVFGWQGTMTIIFIIGLILFISIYFFVPETLRERKESINILQSFHSYYKVITNKIFLNFSLVGAIQSGIFFSFFAFLPYEFSRMGISPLEFGFWLSFCGMGYFLGNVINGFYAKVFGINIMCFVGCLISAFALVLMLALNFFSYKIPIFISLPLMLFGFGNGITVANAIIGAISKSGSDAGSATGLTGAMQMAAGGILGSFIISMGGDESFKIAIFILIILSSIAVYNSILVMRYNND